MSTGCLRASVPSPRRPPGDLCLSADQMFLMTRRDPLRNPDNIPDSLWPFVRLWGPHEINGHRNPPEPARNPRRKAKPLRIRLYEQRNYAVSGTRWNPVRNPRKITTASYGSTTYGRYPAFNIYY